MILYQINKNKNIDKITVKGHALFGDYGTDIVCASVSTAIIMTVNAIEVLGYQTCVKTKLKAGNFEIKVLESNSVVEGLLTNLEYTLNELTTQYETYIKNQKEG